MALADPNGATTVANPYGQVDVAPGEMYIGAAGGVQWMTLPGWEYGHLDETNPVESLYEIDADGRLYGGQLWFGMAVDTRPGEHTRIQLEGSYAEGDLDGRQFRPDPPTSHNYILLGAGGITSINGDSEATLDVDVRGWEVGLRALTDARSDTSSAFTPSFMVFGGGASQDYDANFFDDLPCPDCFENFARQDVDSWYVGLEAAIAATVNLSPTVALTLGGRVAGIIFSADMDGEDCHDSDGTDAPGCDGVEGSSTVSDGLEAVTYRGGGFVGVSYDFGGVSVGIMGTADYVPMADIVNPLFVGDSPSHLDLTHEAVYSARGSIVIPLN